MASRLDSQRPPGRYHKRYNRRYMKRGGAYNPTPVWGDNLGIGPDRAKAAPWADYPADSNITASDAPNAALLAGEGFVATPTSNWTTGQRITVGGFAFNWNGSAWAAGAHA